MKGVKVTKPLEQANVAEMETVTNYLAFIGVNFIQSAFTGFCPAKKLLATLRAGKEGATRCG